MRTKLFLMLFALLVAGTSYAHDLEPLHVDGRYLKNPNGDIVTLHGWITGWGDLCTGYYEYTDYEARLAAWKLTTDSILAAGYKLDYARLHLGGDLNPGDFDSFVQRGDFEKVFLPMVDYLNSKGIYVLLMANVRAEGDSDVRTIGDSWHQRLMKYWQLVSTHPRIKNNPGVMFELANEPMEFMDSDGSKNNFKTMKNYFQPIADLTQL